MDGISHHWGDGGRASDCAMAGVLAGMWGRCSFPWKSHELARLNFQLLLALRSSVQSGSFFFFFQKKAKTSSQFPQQHFPFVILGIERTASASGEKLFYKKMCFCFFLSIADIGEIKLSSSFNLFLLHSYRHLFLRIVESPDAAKMFAA